MIVEIIKALPKMWKVKVLFEALCMFKVEYMSCYRNLRRR